MGKRIALLANGEPYGGGSWQYASFLLDALYELKNLYDINIVYLDNYEQWSEIAKRYGFEHQYLPYRGLYPFYLHKLLDPLKYDLIIDSVQNETCLYIDTPVVSIVHDLMHRYEKFPEILSEYKTREEKYRGVAEYAQTIFVDSELGRQQFIDCYGQECKDRIAVLPFRVPDYLLQSNNNSYSKGNYIFYPAQFWEHKNHEGLIRAAHKLRKRDGLDVRLLFVGSKKNNYDKITSLIDALDMSDNVEIKGYVDDDEMTTLYDNARAMMMASFCGPTNIPPIEAMYRGCPCAVADVYAMPWQVGEAGLLFDPRSVESIAVAMKRLWTDDALCMRLSELGRERVKYFSKDLFNQRFSRAIDDTLAGIRKNGRIQKSFTTNMINKTRRCFTAHVLRR